MPLSENEVPINDETATRLRVENSPLRFFSLRTIKGAGQGSSLNHLRANDNADKITYPTHARKFDLDD